MISGLNNRLGTDVMLAVASVAERNVIFTCLSAQVACTLFSDPSFVWSPSEGRNCEESRVLRLVALLLFDETKDFCEKVPWDFETPVSFSFQSF